MFAKISVEHGQGQFLFQVGNESTFVSIGMCKDPLDENVLYIQQQFYFKNNKCKDYCCVQSPTITVLDAFETFEGNLTIRTAPVIY